MAISGEAAPVCVPGAMAATSAESKIKNPAEAPRDPAGEMKMATGTGDSRMWWMMSSIEVERPPGVSIVIKIRLA